MLINTEKINKDELNFYPPEVNEILNKKILKNNSYENNLIFYWVVLISFY